MTANGEGPEVEKEGINDYFQEAFNDYRNQLSQKPKKRQFIGDIELSNGNASAEELQEAVEALVRQCENKKLRQFWRKYLTPVVNGLDELSGVVGGTVQVVSNIPQAMPLAIVWGGLKFMMGWAQRFNTIFEQIKDELETLSDHIFRLSSCKEIYSITPYSAPSVQRILARSYKTILLFWYRVTKELRRKSITQLARAMFPSGKLKKILDQLDEDAEALERVCDFAEKELQNQSRGLVEDIKAALTDERVKAAIERAAAAEERKLNESRWENTDEQLKVTVQHLKELIKRQELAKISIENENTIRRRQERENRRRQAISSIRGDSSRSIDLLRDMIKERHPRSCEWLFDSPDFRMWSAEQCDTPVFWLNGMHGAGKSFLCSAAIERIRRSADAPTTAIQYLKKGMEVSKSHILQNIAYQMIKALEAAHDDVADDIVKLVEECKDDSGLFESLVTCLFSELKRIYIFIDGLDEASNGSDIQALVQFLVAESIRTPNKVRLWFGSQPLPQIEQYMRKSAGNHLVEKAMHVIDTQADIKTYLESAIPESVGNGSEFAQVLVQSCMETEVEGSFLWASSMISDLKEKAEDADDMVRLALRGLPTRMDDVYRGIIEEYKKQDRTKKLLHSNLPLWRIILSLLTYTKRPLRLLELREGIAMLRSGTDEDLNTSKFVTLTAIRKECSRLVRFIQTEDSEEDGTLELNHSAVFAFLRETSDINEVASEERVVLPSLICDLCIKYLSQPRYSKLLTRRTHFEFTARSGESISIHQLLLYTAKYWYRHCDERATSPDYHERLRQLILSQNFYTLIQVQSLSIIGHFLLSFDRITGQPTSMKKILPACVKDISEDGAHILPQFNDFLYEWSEFLQLGLTSEFNGEIDRCFWRALGPEHFLRLGQERYHSFHFASPRTTSDASAATKNFCFFHSLTPDGQELVLCGIQSSKYVARLADCHVAILTFCRECEDGTLSLSVERWCVDGTRTPFLVETISLKVSCADVQWSLYSTPCSRKLAFVPRSTSIITPGGFALLNGRSGLRVGSRIMLTKDNIHSLNDIHPEFSPTQGTTLGKRDNKTSDEEIPDAGTLDPRTTGMPKDAAILTEYCEEIAHQANLLIICRRKIPKPEVSGTESEKISRFSPNTRRRRNLSDSSDGDSSTSDQENDSDDDEHDTKGPAFSDSNSLRSAASSDTLRSASGDSESSDEDSSGFGSENASSLSDDFNMVSDSEEGSDDLDICPSSEDGEEGDTSGSDSRSLLSAATSDSSDEEVHDSLVDGEESKELGSHYEYPVGIRGQIPASAKNCDSCGELQIETWYHCAICQRNDYDLCHDCVKTGQWCLNKEHQLYEEISGEGVVSVISWSRFVLGQELLVFDTTSTMEEPIFSHSLSDSATLHQSTPIVHPTVPLVVWPICAGKLLFADMRGKASSKKRSFSLQSFKATSKKARQISIDLYFSPCGTFLHVGSVEAIQRKLKCVPRTKSSLREKQYNLAFHVTTMRLSPTDPARRRPTIISRQCHALGIWTKQFVSILPYSWSWTPAATYFTMTGPKLRVYRIPLPSPHIRLAEKQEITKSTQPSCCSPALITTPSETIFLPRSARERSVNFFPPRELSTEKQPHGETPGSARNSTLIIGPRYGPKPSPPIGVYLSETDLGPWINIHDKEGEERMRPPKRRFTGAFEEFDEDDDCDIIPFDDGR